MSKIVKKVAKSRFFLFDNFLDPQPDLTIFCQILTKKCQIGLGVQKIVKLKKSGFCDFFWQIFDNFPKLFFKEKFLSKKSTLGMRWKYSFSSQSVMTEHGTTQYSPVLLSNVLRRRMTKTWPGASHILLLAISVDENCICESQSCIKITGKHSNTKKLTKI